MPRLPTAADLGGRPVISGQPYGLPRGPSGATGEALQQVGRQLGQAGDELAQAQERADTLRVEAATNADLEKVLDLEEGPDGFKHIKGAAILNRDVHGEYLGKFDNLVKQTQSTLANDSQRGKHKQRADYLRLQFRRGLLGHIDREGEIAAKETYSNTLNIEARRAAANWQDRDAVMTSLARLDGVIRNEAERDGWTPEKLEYEVGRVLSVAHEGVVGKALESEQFAYAKDYFEDVKDILDPDSSERIKRALDGKQREIEAEARQRQALARVDVLERERDEEASVLATGNYQGNRLTRQEYVAAYGPEEGPKRYDSLQKVWKAGAAVQEMALAGPQERAAILTKFQPVAGPGFAEGQQVYDIVRKAAVEQQKAREDDPAGYVTRFMPSVQRSYEAMLKAPDDVEAARDYVRQVQAASADLGIQNAAVIPNAMADAISARFYEQKAGGEPAALSILAEREKWGDQWPAVWQQLAPKLPEAAFVIGMGMNPVSGRLLAEASADPQTGKPIPMAELRATLADGEAKPLRDKVRSALDEALLSYAGQPGSEKMATALLESAERLAIHAHMSPEDAADAVFNERYEFIERDDATIRVPKQYDAEAVEDALSVVTADLSGQARVEESQWVTLPNDEGVALTWMGGLVEGANGPIVYTWDQLLNRGATDERARELRHRELMRPSPGAGGDAR